MKYNRSEIMKRAWEIKRAENTTIGAALVKAWAEAKCKNTMTTTTVVVKCNGEFVDVVFAFPKLDGTEKQNAYADDLRAKRLRMFCGHFPKAYFDKKGLDYATEIVKIFAAKRSVNLATTSAKEIINALA